MPIINVQLVRGRTEEQKQELTAVFTEEAARILNVDPETIWITFEEYDRTNWASGGKLHSIKYGTEQQPQREEQA